MKLIASNETEITGKTLFLKGRVERDETFKRIDDLISNYLLELGHDSSGWDTLYYDPKDGRFWERIYPKSHMQGGGPPQLRCLSENQVKSKYGNEVLLS